MRGIRKRIGVMISQPEAAYQRQLLNGILSESYHNNYDVVIFSTFLRNGCSERFQEGELNIFRTINYDEFAGFIIVPDTLLLPGLIEMLYNELKQHYNGPVAVIDANSDTYTTIINNDDDAIHAITDHLINIHKCKDIAFVTGPFEHPHAQLRLKGYLDSLKAHGISPVDSRIFYGNFWYDCADAIVEKLLANGREALPDAIACACDPTALGIIEALRSRNIRVPDDIIVSGYDSDGAGITKYHRVTSLPRRNTLLGTNAVRYLHSRLSGVNYVPRACTYSEDDLIKASCGCEIDYPTKLTEEEPYYRTAYDHNGFDSGFNFMMEDTIGAVSLSDCLWNVDYYTHFIGSFEHFYLCLCDSWNDTADTIIDNSLINGYSSEMILALEKTSEYHSVDFKRKFLLSDMLPALYEDREEPCSFYFSPLHFNEHCFGYIVLSLGASTEPFGINYCRWARNLNNALESMRRQNDLKYMYSNMEKRAERDMLTGLYNRNGYYLYSDEMLYEACTEHKQLLIIVGDLNCLKHINDTYGHNEGDEAIRIASEAIRNTLLKDNKGKAFRIGGDEFVYLETGTFSDTQICERMENTRSYLHDYNEKFLKPFDIYLGLGAVYDYVNPQSKVEDFVKRADAEMYVDKNRFKAQHPAK